MTVVLDASVVIEYLVDTPIGTLAADRLMAHAGDVHVPHLAVVESTSVLRGWAGRRIPEQRALGALDDLRDLPARRWPVEPFLPRIWELRANVTAYDATYVALAEALDADLLTTDARMARGLSRVPSCRVVVLAL